MTAGARMCASTLVTTVYTTMTATTFSIPGESGATAREKHSDGVDELIGVYAQGDTFYEVTIFGTQTVPQSDLANLMTGEHGRLAHG